jgi:hypothetical protein
MALVINYSLFRKRIKRVVVKSIRYSVPWREYVLDWGGMVRELECSTVVNSLKLSIDVVCKEIGRSREYLHIPILVIENDNGVVTVLVGD